MSIFGIAKIILTFVFTLVFSLSASAGNWNQSSSNAAGFKNGEVDEIEAQLPQNYQFAKDFFVDKISNKTCIVDGNIEKRIASTRRFLQVAPNKMYSKSTSLDIAFEYIAQPLHDLLANIYTARAIGDFALQKRLATQVAELAEAKVMADWMDWNEAAVNETCWEGGNASAICKVHYPEIVQGALAGIIISSILLRPHFSDSELKILNSYFYTMHEKFVKPLAFNTKKIGFTANANGGFANIAFAIWNEDHKLFRKEIAQRVWQMSKLITNEGYIEGNSWRGVRDYWYHTIGVDQMFSYALVARANGVDLFSHPLLKAKFQALVDTTLRGRKEKAWFSSKGFRGINYSTEISHARPHIHQEALNLAFIIKQEFGRELIHEDLFFERKENDINIYSGFNASCAYGHVEGYTDPVATTVTSLVGDIFKQKQFRCRFSLKKSGKDEKGVPYGYFQASGKLDIAEGNLRAVDVNWNVRKEAMKSVPNEKLLQKTMSLVATDSGELYGNLSVYASSKGDTRTIETDANYQLIKQDGNNSNPDKAALSIEGIHRFIVPIPHLRPYPDVFDLRISRCRK